MYSEVKQHLSPSCQLRASKIVSTNFVTFVDYNRKENIVVVYHQMISMLLLFRVISRVGWSKMMKFSGVSRCTFHLKLLET